MKTTAWLAKEFILPGAVSSIRDAIEKAGENEIFMVRRLNDDLMVMDVDVYAMGNKTAVPALIKEAKCGDVIIHNTRMGFWNHPMQTLRLHHIWGLRMWDAILGIIPWNL